MMCSAGAERDVHCVHDVSFGRDVRFTREKEHISSLCGYAAKHHCVADTTSLAR